MPKNVVICYDGTGNEYGVNNTNVVKTFQAILRNGKDQVAFYDPGVGTFSFLGEAVGRRLGKIMGRAFGYGLVQNLEDGYEYLMNHWEEGDRLFIFGFSRGAFQARALAGMLHRFGLLERGSNNLIHYVSTMYNQISTYRFRRGATRPTVQKGFKNTFSRVCKPHCVGVWDTVASLGWFYGHRFFDAKINDDIGYGFHAMAIDERRRKFPVMPWDNRVGERADTVQQVWFAGVHSDVGGYYIEHGLSDIALEWMLGKAEGCGLLLKEDWRSEVAPKVLSRADDEMHDSYEGGWRLWRPVHRSIPHGAKVHKSVKARMTASAYNPPNLPKNVQWVD